MPDPEFAQMPWRQCDSFGDLLLEKRRSGFENTGTNEGTMREVIRVRHRDGTVYLQREVTLHWAHFDQIGASFSDDGKSVVVTTSQGRDRVWALSDARREGQ